ncbi:Uncharacterised protein [Streptococcus pneumoniae]|nr:Uncharacterised protein [Streptococcus pneumoniae]
MLIRISICRSTFANTYNNVVSINMVTCVIWIIINIFRTIENFTVLNFHHRNSIFNRTMISKTSNSATNFNWFFNVYCTFNNRFLNCSISTYSIVIASILRPVSYTCSLSFLPSNIGIYISLFYQSLPVFTNNTSQERTTCTNRGHIPNKSYISQCTATIYFIYKSRYPVFTKNITCNFDIFNSGSTFNNIS